MNGYGEFHAHKKGDIYEGQWVNNEFTGEGRKIWRNGEKCIGNWLKGKLHGQAECYNIDGSFAIKGIWENGIFKKKLD